MIILSIIIIMTTVLSDYYSYHLKGFLMLLYPALLGRRALLFWLPERHEEDLRGRLVPLPRALASHPRRQHGENQ
jgi:hypothetical protein